MNLSPLLLVAAFSAAACAPVLAPQPSSSAPAPEPATTTPASTAQPAPKQATAPAEFADREMKLGAAAFRASLPCTPKADKADKDDSDLGPMTFQMFECEDEARGATFSILVAKFERALPASASAAVKTSKNAAAAKDLAGVACHSLKEEGGKCKAPAPRATADGAESAFKVTAGENEMSIRVVARYPYVAVGMAAAKDAADVEKALSSVKLPE